jgi:hypothetical protein
MNENVGTVSEALFNLDIDSMKIKDEREASLTII